MNEESTAMLSEIATAIRNISMPFISLATVEQQLISISSNLQRIANQSEHPPERKTISGIKRFPMVVDAMFLTQLVDFMSSFNVYLNPVFEKDETWIVISDKPISIQDTRRACGLE